MPDWPTLRHRLPADDAPLHLLLQCSVAYLLFRCSALVPHLSLKTLVADFVIFSPGPARAAGNIRECTTCRTVLLALQLEHTVRPSSALDDCANAGLGASCESATSAVRPRHQISETMTNCTVYPVVLVCNRTLFYNVFVISRQCSIHFVSPQSATALPRHSLLFLAGYTSRLRVTATPALRFFISPIITVPQVFSQGTRRTLHRNVPVLRALRPLYHQTCSRSLPTHQYRLSRITIACSQSWTCSLRKREGPCIETWLSSLHCCHRIISSNVFPFTPNAPIAPPPYRRHWLNTPVG